MSHEEEGTPVKVLHSQITSQRPDQENYLPDWNLLKKSIKKGKDENSDVTHVLNTLDKELQRTEKFITKKILTLLDRVESITNPNNVNENARSTTSEDYFRVYGASGSPSSSGSQGNSSRLVRSLSSFDTPLQLPSTVPHLSMCTLPSLQTLLERSKNLYEELVFMSYMNSILSYVFNKHILKIQSNSVLQQRLIAHLGLDANSQFMLSDVPCYGKLQLLLPSTTESNTATSSGLLYDLFDSVAQLLKTHAIELNGFLRLVYGETKLKQNNSVTALGVLKVNSHRVSTLDTYQSTMTEAIDTNNNKKKKEKKNKEDKKKDKKDKKDGSPVDGGSPTVSDENGGKIQILVPKDIATPISCTFSPLSALLDDDEPDLELLDTENSSAVTTAPAIPPSEAQQETQIVYSDLQPLLATAEHVTFFLKLHFHQLVPVLPDELINSLDELLCQKEQQQSLNGSPLKPSLTQNQGLTVEPPTTEDRVPAESPSSAEDSPLGHLLWYLLPSHEFCAAMLGMSFNDAVVREFDVVFSSARFIDLPSQLLVYLLAFLDSFFSWFMLVCVLVFAVELGLDPVATSFVVLAQGVGIFFAEYIFAIKIDSRDHVPDCRNDDSTAAGGTTHLLNVEQSIMNYGATQEQHQVVGDLEVPQYMRYHRAFLFACVTRILASLALACSLFYPYMLVFSAFCLGLTSRNGLLGDLIMDHTPIYRRAPISVVVHYSQLTGKILAPLLGLVLAFFTFNQNSENVSNSSIVNISPLSIGLIFTMISMVLVLFSLFGFNEPPYRVEVEHIPSSNTQRNNMHVTACGCALNCICAEHSTKVGSLNHTHVHLHAEDGFEPRSGNLIFKRGSKPPPGAVMNLDHFNILHQIGRVVMKKPHASNTSSSAHHKEHGKDKKKKKKDKKAKDNVSSSDDEEAQPLLELEEGLRTHSPEHSPNEHLTLPEPLSFALKPRKAAWIEICLPIALAVVSNALELILLVLLPALGASVFGFSLFSLFCIAFGATLLHLVTLPLLSYLVTRRVATTVQLLLVTVSITLISISGILFINYGEGPTLILHHNSLPPVLLEPAQVHEMFSTDTFYNTTKLHQIAQKYPIFKQEEELRDPLFRPFQLRFENHKLNNNYLFNQQQQQQQQQSVTTVSADDTIESPIVPLDTTLQLYLHHHEHVALFVVLTVLLLLCLNATHHLAISLITAHDHPLLMHSISQPYRLKAMLHSAVYIVAGLVVLLVTVPMQLPTSVVGHLVPNPLAVIILTVVPKGVDGLISSLFTPFFMTFLILLVATTANRKLLTVVPIFTTLLKR